MANGYELGRMFSSLRIIQSVFIARTADPNDPRRQAYRSQISTEPQIPLNVEEEVRDGFYSVVLKRGLSERSFDYKTPYWSRDQLYNPLDILTTTIAFSDDHNEPLPQTTLPPQEDIQRFAGVIMGSGRRNTVVDQFQLLLDITGDNVVGAANLGFITSRFFARNTDRRAYPGIQLTFDDMRLWDSKVAQFEVYGEDPKMHASSDTYYFWTHFFVAMIGKLDGRPWARLLNQSFSKGTDLMVLTRKYLVGRPTVTSHREASMLGRNVGFAIADLF